MQAVSPAHPAQMWARQARDFKAVAVQHAGSGPAKPRSGAAKSAGHGDSKRIVLCQRGMDRIPARRRAAPVAEKSPPRHRPPPRLGVLARGGLRRAAIGRVADQRMADMGQMHADLMCAPGLEPAFDQRGERRGPPAEASPARDSACARACPARAAPPCACGRTGLRAEVALDHARRRRAARPRPRRCRRARRRARRTAWRGCAWRARSWRRPEARWCPCRAGARCRAAPRRRCPSRSPQWASSALTSVPSGLPAAGCTTSPAGLSMTMRSASS